MQDVLKHMSLQQSKQSKDAEPIMRPQLSTEPSPNALVHKLKQVVAEKDANIQQLKKQIQQLSLRVNTHISDNKSFDFNQSPFLC